MRQLPPVFGPEFDDRELLARAVGLGIEDLDPDLPAQTVSTGLPPLLVPIRTWEPLGAPRSTWLSWPGLRAKRRLRALPVHDPR